MSAVQLDSITDAGAAARGRVVVTGSHGGLYPAAVASATGVRAVVFNDAGIGFQQAGVAGVLALDEVGTAAIAADCMTCRIGDAQDMLDRGLVSTVNEAAARLGVRPGMTVSEAVERMTDAPAPTGTLPKVTEARRSRTLGSGQRVDLLDSASLVGPEDAGCLVITGSHGALIGGNPDRALKAPARVAVFNDAGVGIEQIGITRLPALQTKGIAAVTVAAASARIGDAASALEAGVISFVNDPAAAQCAARFTGGDVQLTTTPFTPATMARDGLVAL